MQIMQPEKERCCLISISLGNMTPLDFSQSVVEDAVHEAGILTA
jgi:hypothetical protein